MPVVVVVKICKRTLSLWKFCQTPACPPRISSFSLTAVALCCLAILTRNHSKYVVSDVFWVLLPGDSLSSACFINSAKEMPLLGVTSRGFLTCKFTVLVVYRIEGSWGKVPVLSTSLLLYQAQGVSALLCEAFLCPVLFSCLPGTASWVHHLNTWADL